MVNSIFWDNDGSHGLNLDITTPNRSPEILSNHIRLEVLSEILPQYHSDPNTREATRYYNLLQNWEYDEEPINADPLFF